MNKPLPLYQLKKIQHYYGDKKVLDIPGFSIEKGSITGLIGPNGSGKSTLLKLLAFALAPTHGVINYLGTPEHPFSKSIRSKVTLLTQKPYLLKRTVYENIIYGLKIRKKTNRFVEKAEKSLQLVGLDYKEFSNRLWHELSGGEAQRVALAARLILKPEVLLLDEPVASVDVKSAVQIRKAALAARDDWGTTLIIVSHDFSWLFSVSDHQVSLMDGKLFASGDENIIPGPFETIDGSHIRKTMDNSQSIILSAPEKTNATALLKKENTRLETERLPEQPGVNQVEGLIMSMHIEKKQNQVMMVIDAAGITFQLGFNPEQISQKQLMPGKAVYLIFNTSDIIWI